jgi:hypothetical protein
VRIDDGLEVVRVRLARPPLAGRWIVRADRTPQSPVVPDGSSELLRELAEKALAREIAARPRYLVAEHLGKAEVLKQRDDVGECFVERESVRTGRLDEPPVHPVEEGVRCLVCDDVV